VFIVVTVNVYLQHLFTFVYPTVLTVTIALSTQQTIMSGTCLSNHGGTAAVAVVKSCRVCRSDAAYYVACQSFA